MEGKIFGYHRTSTTDQHLDRGIKAIENYCDANGLKIEMMLTDQQTGKNFDRPDYNFLKNRLAKKGDVILVSELDRLGRNKEATLSELQHFKEKGVRIMILEIPTTLLDYSSMPDDMARMMMETINNMLIEMYATFAHAEMQKREKRQKEGIQAMKDRGEYGNYGRKPTVSFNKFSESYKKVLAGDLRPFECIKQLGISNTAYYRQKKIFEKLGK